MFNLEIMVYYSISSAWNPNSANNEKENENVTVTPPISGKILPSMSQIFTNRVHDVLLIYAKLEICGMHIIRSNDMDDRWCGVRRVWGWEGGGWGV